MGGRKPKAPRVIPGKPPKGMMGGVIGGARSALLGTPSRPKPPAFDGTVYAGGSSPIRGVGGHEYLNNPKYAEHRREYYGKKKRVDKFGNPITKPGKDTGYKGPRGTLRFIGTPPPGSEFDENDRLVKRGRRKNPRGRRIGRKISNEEKMKIKAKYDERRKLRKEKGFADRGTIKRGSGRRRGPVSTPGFPSDGPRRGPVSTPGFPSDGPRPMPRRRGRRRRPPTAVMETTRVPVKDPTLGGPPEREVPIPKETLPAITRESDPTGPAPFAPNERAMAQDRFFERMFEKADARKQQESMMREERGRVKQSMRDESRMRMNEPGEINVGGEININAERRPRRRRMRR